MSPSATVYMKSAAFGPHKFPLPGDIQVVTGGPPCQGQGLTVVPISAHLELTLPLSTRLKLTWSAYNPN